MPRTDVTVFADRYIGRYRQHQALVRLRVEAAALIATDQVSRQAQEGIRAAMRGANLGRLGQAIGQTSDMQKGRVHRQGNEWSASGTLFIRSRSERTLGAIEAYTMGASIKPVRGRWLWRATDEIPRVAGAGSKRERVTPANWSKFGLDTKIGPLVQIRSINGYPLLVVRGGSVNAAGAPRKARALTKTGRARKSQREKAFIVAFVAIPNTARAARVNIREIVERERQHLPALLQRALETTAR